MSSRGLPASVPDLPITTTTLVGQDVRVQGGSMARTLKAFALIGMGCWMVACSDDTPPESAASSTTSAADELVTETRQITAEELARLSDDDGHLPLPCPGMGAATWDYGPISEDEKGREAVDALEDAISDLNDDGAILPAAGWTELVVEEGSRRFVLEDDVGSFVAAVEVEGDPTLGTWRHLEAFVCPTGGA